MTIFKSLPLDQESINTYVNSFVESNSYRIDNRSQYVSGSGNDTHRYIIGKMLIPSATIEFICNKDGTTTVHYKLGKNPDLGLELAEYVK